MLQRTYTILATIILVAPWISPSTTVAETMIFPQERLVETVSEPPIFNEHGAVVIENNAIVGSVQTAEIVFKQWEEEQKRAAKPKAVHIPKKTSNQVQAAVAEVTLTKVPNKFAKGNCTFYVADKLQGKVTWRGNANRWAANAKAQGYLVDKNPAVGAILVTNESRAGHVAYIEAVSGTIITFTEWNYAGLYKKTTRTMDISDSRIKAIIHVP